MNPSNMNEQQKIHLKKILLSIIDNEIDSIINSLYDDNKVNALTSQEIMEGIRA